MVSASDSGKLSGLDYSPRSPTASFMTQSFPPDQIRCFHFGEYTFDEATATARLHYALDDQYQFEETLQFPPLAATLTPVQRIALDHSLRLLHLVAGISYFKAAIPREIVIDGEDIDTGTAEFLQRLYRHGLGEFAYRNHLTLHDRITFPHDPANAPPEAISLPLQNGVLIPVGGGKDSIVSIEAIKASNLPAALFSVGKAAPIAATVQQAGLPWISVQRSLSPQLFELNRIGAYNGHIPVTAIVSLIAVCSAILFGYSAIALSNERSASYGNLQLDDGFIINHQYSKGLEFEHALATYIHRHLVANLDYFSLLRPFSELHIARQFSRCNDYHSLFTSCNSNFRIKSDLPGSRWCLDCPKCRFVFLALAPFMNKEKLLATFGKNLLDDNAQKPGYDALLGIDDHKPFECVGEEAECAAAFILLSGKPEWSDDRLVANFRENILPGISNPDNLARKYLTPSNAHHIPVKYKEVVDAFFRT